MTNRRRGVGRRAKSWLGARIVESGGSRASLVHPEVDLLSLPGLGSALSELRAPTAVELDELASIWVNVGPRSPCVQYRSVTMGGYRFAHNPGLISIHLRSKSCLGRRARGPMRTRLMIYFFDTKIKQPGPPTLQQCGLSWSPDGWVEQADTLVCENSLCDVAWKRSTRVASRSLSGVW